MAAPPSASRVPGFIGASSVTIDNNPVVSFVVKSNGEITTTTLAHAAGPATIAVTVPGGGTGTLPGGGMTGFTYVLPPPVVTTVTPPAGSTAGGTSVTISGQNFTGANSVTIGESR